MPLPHMAFLLFATLVAVTPLVLAPGRGRLFAPIWLVWIMLWGGLALPTAFGVFTFSPPILRLAAHFGGQVVVGVSLFLLVPTIRAAIRSIPLNWLVRWQQARVIGGFFLIGAAMGEVPWTFALIAGLGDIAVGITAFVTARAMTPANAHRLAGRHMAMGIADFTIAISTAIITGASLGWPYIMIPLFLVPMALLGHLAVLDRILPRQAQA
ncbi:MAG: hypothetical protein ACRCS3_02890 [Paracoccaceae bacterium]